jgi:hypothetical protein
MLEINGMNNAISSVSSHLIREWNWSISVALWKSGINSAIEVISYIYYWTWRKEILQCPRVCALKRLHPACPSLLAYVHARVRGLYYYFVMSVWRKWAVLNPMCVCVRACACVCERAFVCARVLLSVCVRACECVCVRARVYVYVWSITGEACVYLNDLCMNLKLHLILSVFAVKQ